MISVRSLRLALPAFAAAAVLAAAAAPAAQAASSHGAGTKPVVPTFTFNAHTAGPAAFAPPQAGVAPGVASAGQGNPSILFYTGSNIQVFAVLLPPSPPAVQSLGGRLVGGPGPTFVPPGSLQPAPGAIALFGRGTDNALWVFTGTPGVWASLGGVLTSRPGAAAGNLTGGESVDVAVRGSDGAVWEKHLTTSIAPWRSLGGRVLAGTGPAAVNVGGTLFVLVVGTDHAVWVNKSTDASHWSGWRSLGGRTNSTLAAATPAPGAGVAFVRGTDNALWFNEFAGTTAGVFGGWHSRGGVLTSGTGAGSEPDGMTWAVVLGTDGHVWANSGVWPAHAWSRVF